jgi:hypothetical protein
MKAAVVDLIERRTNGIRRGVSGTALTLLEFWVCVARKNVLLAEIRIGLDSPTEWTGAYGVSGAARKLACIEFEDKPPLHRLPRGNHWCRLVRACRTRQSNGNQEKADPVHERRRARVRAAIGEYFHMHSLTRAFS